LFHLGVQNKLHNKIINMKIKKSIIIVVLILISP
jgi:hypothetical protein